MPNSNVFEFHIMFRDYSWILKQYRMRYIKVVPGYFYHKVMHIRRLVLPMLCWAAGFSVIPKEVWQNLRKQVYSVFEAKLLHDTAKCILHEIMGWTVDPHFAICQYQSWRNRSIFKCVTCIWKCNILTISMLKDLSFVHKMSQFVVVIVQRVPQWVLIETVIRDMSKCWGQVKRSAKAYA